MQKRTFEGLKRSAVCVDERFRRLERITSLVNQCKELIYDELSKIIPADDLISVDSEKIIKSKLKEHANEIKIRVKEELDTVQDTVFVKFYFDILYLELTTLCSNLFHHELTSIYCKEILNGFESQLI